MQSTIEKYWKLAKIQIKEETTMVSFAERMNDVKASDIRELLALVNKPEIISFADSQWLPPPLSVFCGRRQAVLIEKVLFRQNEKPIIFPW